MLLALGITTMMVMGGPPALAAPGVGDISTVAGIGPGFGGDGGPATDAMLSHPQRAALDAVGNVYIADRGNHRVRKVDALTRNITTVAGNGVADFSGDGGQASDASLNTPTGVALDVNDNLYIADSSNRRVRKVDASTGIISTVAGNGECCFGGDGGPATDAQFDLPTDVAVDTDDDLYIVDRFGHRIRKVDASTGIISTVAGNGECCFDGDGGPATDAVFNQPIGIGLDASGNLYIADRFNHRIRKVDFLTGVIDTVAGNGCCFGGDGGPATDAQMNQPTDVAFDGSGNLFIADRQNRRIRKVDTGGIITTVAGGGPIGPDGDQGDGGPATSAFLGAPVGVAVDSSGNLLISDTFHNRIRKVDASTEVITTFAGTIPPGFSGDGGAATSALLNSPQAVATDSVGNLFIADHGNFRVRKVDAGGIMTTVAGNGTPTGSIDGEGGDPSDDLGDGGPAVDATLKTAVGVVVDESGNLYVADSSNHRIRKVDTNGIMTTVAGNGTPTGSIDGEGGDPSDDLGDGGPAVDATFNQPREIELDASGNLYITDRDNHRIRRVDAITGIITTIAGTGNATFCGDGGPAIAACLNRPFGIAIDDVFGDLFIADTNNRRLRKVDAITGVITTVAGRGDCCLDGDGGLATDAALVARSVEVDAAGNLFIAEGFVQRVRKVDAASGIITTVAGSGITDDLDGDYSGDGSPATDATMSQPTDVAIDSQGNLFASDIFNHVVRMVEGVAAAAEADLSVTQTAAPDPVSFGESVAYTMTVTNNGPAIATDVVLTNTLIQNGALSSARTLQGAPVTCIPAGETIDCELGTLAVSEQVTVELLVLVIDPQVGGTITNGATVSGSRDDPDLSNNTAIEETAVIFCTLGVTALFGQGTLMYEAELSTGIPAELAIRAFAQNEVVLLRSESLLVVDPPRTISLSKSGVPQVGVVGILLTVTDASRGIICSDWQTFDTGPAPAAGVPEEAVREAFGRGE